MLCPTALLVDKANSTIEGDELPDRLAQVLHGGGGVAKFVKVGHGSCRNNWTDDRFADSINVGARKKHAPAVSGTGFRVYLAADPDSSGASAKKATQSPGRVAPAWLFYLVFISTSLAGPHLRIGFGLCVGID